MINKTIVLFFVFILTIGFAQATTYNVMKNGSGNYTTIQACANVVAAGDECRIFEGYYNESVSLTASGSAGNYINFTGGDNNASVRSFTLIRSMYVTIQNLEIWNNMSGIRGIILANTSNVNILNNYFYNTGGSAIVSVTGSFLNSTSNWTVIRNNLFSYIPAGVISLVGDSNLIEGNDMSHHQDCIYLYGDRNVFRNNTCRDSNNLEWDAAPDAIHFDAVQYSDSTNLGIIHPLTHLLVEHNYMINISEEMGNVHFVLLQEYKYPQGANGSDTIVRYNDIYGVSGAVGSTLNYTHTKVYNNDILHGSPDNSSAWNGSVSQWSIVGMDYQAGFNKIINNIFYNTTRNGGWPYDIGNHDTGLSYTSWTGTNYSHNLGYNPSCGGSCTWSNPFNSEPNVVKNQDPLFVTNNTNLNLQSGSPALNAGGPLTYVENTDTGSGTTLYVNDSRLFQDGWAGVNPDWIAVGSVTNVVQIISINYSTETLTLNTSISRNDGDSVYLYKDSFGTRVLYGAAPDIGAYEYNPNQPICGNNIVESGEACDGTNLSSFTCNSAGTGLSSGTLLCNLDCKQYNVSQCVEGNIVNVESCEKTNVQEAIGNASEGDLIIVPSGNCTWNSTVTVGKAVTIKGHNTILTAGAQLNNGFFHITGFASNALMRITNFTFVNRVSDIGVSGVSNVRVQGNSISLKNLRIDHNILYYGYEAIDLAGSFGVIDNNYFYNPRKGISFTAGNRTQADASWESLEAGTGNALFIENNYFITDENYPLAYTQEQIGTSNGGKLVIRSNNFNASNMSSLLASSSTYDSFMAHGSADGGCGGAGYWENSSCQRRGQSVIEFYGNIESGKRIDFMYTSRGSANIIYNNSIRGIVTYNPSIYLREEEYSASDWNISRTTWPAEDQVHNTFIWNNTYRGYDFNEGAYGAIITSPTNYDCTATGTPMACCTGSGTGTCGSTSAPTTNPFLRKDRDYFLHAPCESTDLTDGYGNNCTYGKEIFIGENGASNSSPTDNITYPNYGTMTFIPTGDNAYYNYVPYPSPHPLTLIEPVICGDLICSESETCSICSQDCGVCTVNEDDENDNSGGGGGGGSSGGAIANISKNSTNQSNTNLNLNNGTNNNQNYNSNVDKPNNTKEDSSNNAEYPLDLNSEKLRAIAYYSSIIILIVSIVIVSYILAHAYSMRKWGFNRFSLKYYLTHIYSKPVSGAKNESIDSLHKLPSSIPINPSNLNNSFNHNLSKDELRNIAKAVKE